MRKLLIGVAIVVIAGVGLASAGNDELAAPKDKRKVECDCCKKEGGAAQPMTGSADVKEYPSCSQCGMHRDKFAYSRTYVEFTDGSCSANCSISCVADELKAASHKKIRVFKVADYGTRELIDADKAFWVMGGDVSGVMTRVPKWAFADKKAAENFVKDHGGQLTSFAEAWKAAQAE